MSSAPRVAIDARHAQAPSPWGSARYARELIAALRDRAGRDGIEPVVVGEGRWAGPEVLWEQWGLARRARAAGAAALHAPNCFLPLRRPCPGVVTVHDLAFEDHPEDFSRRTGAKFRIFTPRAVRSAERIICVSEFTRRDVCDRYGADPERTRVIHSAPALPRGDAQPPQGQYLLAVGALRPKKNLRRLVEAFRSIHADGLRHHLVLAGPDFGEGRALLAAAGRAPVQLAGQVDDAALDSLMRGAELLIHPSLYEGFGLAPLEAMARGCPVAAARATALPEALGDAAEYFDPRDPVDMAAAMRRVLEDRELRARLVERGRARVAALSWDTTAERTAAVYREVV